MASFKNYSSNYLYIAFANDVRKIHSVFSLFHLLYVRITNTRNVYVFNIYTLLWNQILTL